MFPLRVAMAIREHGKNLFKKGYEYVDISKIGLPETFSKGWLEYDPEMTMKKYYDKHR